MSDGVTIRYSIDLSPLRRIAAAFRDLGQNPAPLLDIWGGVLESGQRQRFDTGRGVGGVPWPASQRVKRHGGKTMVNFVNLQNSSRYEVRGNVVYVGVSDPTKPRAALLALQYGSHRQSVVVGFTRMQSQAFGVPMPVREVRVRGHGRVTNLPARPYVGIDAEDRTELRATGIGYLRGFKAIK